MCRAHGLRATAAGGRAQARSRSSTRRTAPSPIYVGPRAGAVVPALSQRRAASLGSPCRRPVGGVGRRPPPLPHLRPRAGGGPGVVTLTGFRAGHSACGHPGPSAGELSPSGGPGPGAHSPQLHPRLSGRRRAPGARAQPPVATALPELIGQQCAWLLALARAGRRVRSGSLLGFGAPPERSAEPRANHGGLTSSPTTGFRAAPQRHAASHGVGPLRRRSAGHPAGRRPARAAGGQWRCSRTWITRSAALRA